ncbi:hypothetical protein [Endozoicomonas sp. SCSIO W0465]|uniref:hypothetical protein n=1 Tax=Endozoicomonas sp. SCSIO W0465 TaxID=2918516 RepID=UPI00207515DE|nr:hypothetical protein [Endozoicomonas sp. SCSIO W0465]USE37573.1 hypothetical protein MJO57_05005 [Endozoicomonas sp. SCSIO W0465]
MAIAPFRLGNIDQYEDPDAANDKLEQWLNNTRLFFLASPEYQKLSKANKKGEGSWFDMFMNLYLNYIGTDLKDLDVDAAEQIMLDLYPRKLICSDTQAKTIVPELIAYWQMLHRILNGGKQRRLKHAESVITFLDSIRKNYLSIYQGKGGSHPFAGVDFQTLMQEALNPPVGQDNDWVAELIADAARHLPEYKQQPAPPDHWLPLRELTNVAELLDYVCHIGFDHQLPGADEAVSELLGCAFQDVFMRIRQGDQQARTFWQSMEHQIIHSGEDNALNPDGMNVVFAVLSHHKQFLSPQFLEFVHQWYTDNVTEMAPDELTPEAVGQTLQKMISEIPDEFALVSILHEQLAFLPPEGLELISHALITSEKGLNGVALMMLDDNQERAISIVKVLSQNVAAITPVTLARLIRMRNWLKAPVKDKVDKLIQAARKKGIVPSAPEPLPASDILDIYMSAVDGAGAQGTMIILRDGNHQRLISFVLKESAGILDVLVTPPVPKRQIQQYVSTMKQQDLAAERVSMELIHKQLPFFLALNLKSGIAIDHELVQVMELLGVEDWNPESTELTTLFNPLLLKAPSLAEIASVQKRSAKWTQSAIGRSWFEAPDMIGPFSKLNTRSDETFFAEVIAPARGKWAERLGRMALWAHYCTNKNRQKQSTDYAIANWLLAHSDLPAHEISLLNAIARNSI